MKSVGLTVLLGITLFCFAAFAEVAEQEPNESPTHAMSIGSFGDQARTVTVNAAMDYAGDSDWYGFDITASSRELIVSTSTQGASDLQVVSYSDDLNPIEASENQLRLTLAEGSYLVRIGSSDLSVFSYELVISSALELEPNDGICIPSNLGVIGPELSGMFAAIDPMGDVDFFAFEIAQGSEGITQLRTDGVSGDTLMILYQYDETSDRYLPISRDDDSGTGGWSMVFSDLDAGRYIARIHEFGDDQALEAYQFSAVQMAIAECEPNNTAAEACALGSLEVGGVLSVDDLLLGGDIDFFSLTTHADGVLIIETSGPVNADSYVCLLDQQAVGLGCDDDGGSGMWSRMLTPVTAGEYFITVEGYGAEDAFRYTLQASLQQFVTASEQEPNDLPASATVVENTPAIVGGEIGPGDVDFYTFTVPSTTRVVLETTGSVEADSYICLFDSGGDSLWCDDDGGTGLWSRIDDPLPAGTYSVSVEGYSSTDMFSYDLLILLPELEAE